MTLNPFFVRLASIVLVCNFISNVAKADSNEKDQTPNFVVFLVDDMGWPDTECYGSQFHETPNVNKLAQQGLRFTDAYAACPVCSPTRASIMTGKYPATLNLTDFISGHWRPFAKLDDPEFNHALPHEEITIAEMLKAKNYHSGAFGKWHLGPRTHFPDSQGFDEMLVHGGRHFSPNFRMTPPQKFPDGKYLSEILTERADKFIRDNKEKPFVLYLPHYAVHIPLEAPADVVEKYKQKRKGFTSEIQITLDQSLANSRNDFQKIGNGISQAISKYNDRIRFQPMEREANSAILPFQLQVPGDLDLDEVVENLKEIVAKEIGPDSSYSVKVTKGVNHPIYAAMVEMIDRSLGQVMKTLDELNLSDNTVVIFTSDNGGLYRRFDDIGPITSTNVPLRNEKGSLYEGGIRVPMIVRWPEKIKAGTESSLPVSTIDIFPTIASLAGIPLKHEIDGQDLKPILFDQKEKEAQFKERPVFWHYPHYHHTSPGSIVRQGDYKLIEYFEDGKLELFNVREDLSEQKELSSQMPEKRDELHKTLKKWRAKVIAQMPVPNPNYQPEKAGIWGRKGRREELLVPKIKP